MLSIPATGLERYLVRYRRIEQFVETPGDARRYGETIDEVGGLGVHPANMDLPGWRADGPRDRLLNDLRRRQGRGALKLELLEDLVSRPGVDRDRGPRHLDGSQLDRRSGHLHRKVHAPSRGWHVDRFPDRPKADETHGELVPAGRDIMNRISPEGIGGRAGHDLAVPQDRHLGTVQRGSRGAVSHRPSYITSPARTAPTEEDGRYDRGQGFDSGTEFRGGPKPRGDPR